jgi:3-(3-hydroxy-phenyl)propionate hydroxylase
MVPGAPAADAPVQVDGHAGWLLDHLGGRFDLLLFDADDAAAQALATRLGDTVRVVRITSSGAVRGQLIDFEGHAEHRYDARPGTAYLLRPDQHVAARWRSASVDGVRAALARAQGH